jgi:hypothetical protein
MSNANFLEKNDKYGYSIWEDMIDGKSYIFVRFDDETVRYPMKIWREMNKTWNEKGWDSKWDTLACTDSCFPEEL